MDKELIATIRQVIREEVGVKLNNLEEKFKDFKIKMDGMDKRQDEMYQFLRGMEEFKPITNKRLDSLEVDMLKMKNHVHPVTIKTEEAECVSEDAIDLGK